MADMARAKMITIIASAELRERIENDLHRLGATGYSVIMVDGRGRKGPRKRGMLDSGNVRVETVVALGVAETILAHLAGQAETDEMVVFAQDVDAMPRKHFA